MDSLNRRENENAVLAPRDAQLAVANFSARDRLVVDKENVAARRVDARRGLKRDVARARPVQIRVIRRDRIEYDDVRLLDAPRERERKAFKIL